MPNKDKNDRSIARVLDSLNYTYDWEDYSKSEEINEVLKVASKNGEGNIGKPDHIYINEHKKLLIMIEDKPSINKHTSGFSLLETRIDELVLKAKLNSQIKSKKDKVNVFNGTFCPNDYAEDGIVWYLSFFKSCNLSENLKSYFSDWRIIGIAISGNISDEYSHKISTFIVFQNNLANEKISELKSEEDYCNLCNNFVEEDLIQKISISSKKINKWLRSVDSQKRPVLLSALMICLFEHNNENVDNSFISQYNSWLPRSIAESIQNRVDKILEAENISEEKRKVIKAELEFVKVDRELTTTNILKDILNELKTNVISKFSITTNYDIIGKFYEEFLRYAGVANVKKGIVLTPHHITKLFTDLIPVEKDDVFLDSCCGTGAFLIAGMNKLLEIHNTIEEEKTSLLIEKVVDNDINLLSLIETIRNINDSIDNDNYHYSDEDKDELITHIANMKNLSKDEVVSNIISVRKKQKESKFNEIKTNQLVGFEYNPTMYSLAISNMLFRGDGKSKIYYENYFSPEADKELKKLKKFGIKPSIGFINPPYGGKDNKDNPTKKEIQFIERLLTHVSKYLVVIAPLSTFFNNDTERNNIITKNRLLYVINMPQDLFQPNASTNTAIAVFKVGEAQKDKEVIFYDLKDDGFVLSKSKGRTNAYGKWDMIKNEMLNVLLTPSAEYSKKLFEEKHIAVKTTIKNDSEWVIQEYAKTDYSKLNSKSFIDTIKDYLVYKVKKDLDLISDSMNELSMAETLSDYYERSFTSKEYEFNNIDVEKEMWQEINVPQLFDGPIDSCNCSVAGDLQDGTDIYYLGAKKKDCGLIKKVAYDEKYITKGNCIGFICDGDGSIGYHNYIDLDEFIGTTNLSVGYNKDINVYSALFLVTVLDLERPKYSFGRKYKKRINNTNILLPVKKDDKGNCIKNKDGKYIPDFEYMENYIKSLPYSDLI